MMMRRSIVMSEGRERRLMIMLLFQVSRRPPQRSPSPAPSDPALARAQSRSMTAAATQTSAPGRAGTRTRSVPENTQVVWLNYLFFPRSRQAILVIK